MLNIFKSFFSSSSFRPQNFYTLKPEQQECVNFATQCKNYSIEGNLNAVWFHVPNEISNNRQPRFGMMLKAMGKINGAPDYVFISSKKSCFIEFKVKNKKTSSKQSDDQKNFEEWCEKFKIPYFVVYSADEGIEILKKLNMLVN